MIIAAFLRRAARNKFFSASCLKGTPEGESRVSHSPESRPKKSDAGALKYSKMRLFRRYEGDLKTASDYVRKDNKIHGFEA